MTNELITTSPNADEIADLYQDMSVCGAFTRECVKCGHRFDSYTGQRTITHCPECGEERNTCSNLPVKGLNRCRMHMKDVQIVSKGLAKYLPEKMLEYYLDVYEEDGDVLSLKEEIDLMRMRWAALFSDLESEGAGKLWIEAQKTYSFYETARASGNQMKAQEKLAELGGIIRDGYIETLKWAEIMEITKELRQLKKAEAARVDKRAKTITKEQFRSMMVFILNSINTRVSNKKEKDLLFRDLETLNTNK
jgi:hypothetical protein